MRLDDPRLTRLAAATEGLSAVVSFVEESGDHRLSIAAALIEDGEILEQVARQAELGEDDQPCPLRARVGEQTDVGLEVLVEPPELRRELGQRDPQRCHARESSAPLALP